MEKFIKIAKERKAEIVVFPEVAVTLAAGKKRVFLILKENIKIIFKN
jgi:predicted amidohydrolase